MSGRRRSDRFRLKLVIYKSEYRQIQAWTNKYEDLETGGDLFGLWQDDRTAVVKLVVGPGKQCRRTSTSFYQDVDYLKRIGDTLTSEEGLCHIGEWHSHHKLGLSRPSNRDIITIGSNVERKGLSRFVLFIANICSTWSWSHFSYLPDETTVNAGFLFEANRSGRFNFLELQAQFIFNQEESPFRSKYFNAIQEGAESLNTTQDELRVVVKKCQKMESAEQTQAKEETERRLHSSEQRSHELETRLAAQTQAKEETQRILHSSEQRSHELETRLAAQTQAKEETQRRLHSSEQRSHELETRLAAQTQAKEETQRRLHRSEQRSHELETRLAAQTQAKEETVRRLHSSEQRRRELETTLTAVQGELEEALKSREPSCDWIVDRNAIILSNTEIGAGAWGRVVEGTFGGCKVAVKEIHQAILSPYNRIRFEREMGIASKCRHPCLLQFIGATNDDQSPLFVTELLESSLRAVLHERPLEPTEITTIALDVAKGLNYLHLKRPTPIIHRDISSANVLMWKKGTDWRAKVSDYGTANFLQQTMSVCPGAAIYSAPEAHTPVQSPKVDVYSFGVLLCEMSIREQPDVMTRNQQIRRVANHCHRRLIRNCVLPNYEERPSMAEIVEEMKNSE